MYVITHSVLVPHSYDTTGAHKLATAYSLAILGMEIRPYEGFHMRRHNKAVDSMLVSDRAGRD